MKLSTSTGYSMFFENEQVQYNAISNAGFKYINYDISGGDYTAEDYKPLMHAHLEKMKRANLVPIMAHGPYRYPLPDELKEVFHSSCMNAIKCCKAIDIPYIVLHPHAAKGMSHDAFLEENRAMFRRLIPAMEETGVMVLIENIGQFTDPHFVHDGNELKLLIETCDHPLFAACWDTGHANHVVSDQRESIIELGSLLKGLHINDNLGDLEPRWQTWMNDMHTVPLFGTVDFDGVVLALKEIGYEGYFNFEVDKPKWRDFPEGSLIKNKMQELKSEELKLLYKTGELMLAAHGCFEE